MVAARRLAGWGFEGVEVAPPEAMLDWLAERLGPGAPSAVTAPQLSAAPKPRKLSYREQQELEQMEAVILAAEEAVAERHAEVERSATAGHVVLADACRALEEAQRTVERLYARWQELEAKRGS